MLRKDDGKEVHSHWVSWLTTKSCVSNQRTLLSDWPYLNFSPDEYSYAFHNHFKRSLWAYRAWGQRIASGYHSFPILQTWHAAFPRGTPPSSSVFSTVRSVACEGHKPSLIFTFFNYTSLEWSTCDLVFNQRSLCSSSPVCVHCICIWGEDVDRLGAFWPGSPVCWGRLQRGEIRNMRLPGCLCCWKSFPITLSVWPCFNIS